MAAMSTALTEFSNNGDSRTSLTSGHTAEKPNLVLEKRRVPSGNQQVMENVITVLHATEDSEGAILPQRYAFTVTVRGPVNGTTTDRDAALAIFRDIIAGDEFGVAVSKQSWLIP